MERRRFLTWSAVGAALWVVSITLLGYFLGQAFPVLQDKLDVAVVLIVAVSLIPAVVEWWRHRGRTKEIAEDVVSGAAHHEPAEPRTDQR
jgi:membrane-associated protein